MKMRITIVAFVALFVYVRCSPTGGRAMMITGFFGRPPMQQSQGFVYGPPKTPCQKCNDFPIPQETSHVAQELPTQTENVFTQTQQSEVQESSTVSVTGSKTDQENKESDEESSEEDDESWLGFGRRAGSGYNFFPIVFGGRGRSGSGLGGATAIANSFSTGRKGVANSQATAYGDGSSLRNNIPIRTRRSPQEPAPDQFNVPIPEDNTAITEKPGRRTTLTNDDSTENDFMTYMMNGNAPGVYNFFPMQFGGGRGRSNAPNGATAIANSFSTGRRGVASSQATAYGTPSESVESLRSRRQTDIQPNLIESEQETTTEVVSTTEDEPETSTPSTRNVPRRKNPGFFNFFPITFTGIEGRSGDIPVGVAAIANSYTNGRSGVAISSATSYGN